MGEWREVRIGDFLHRVKQSVRLQVDENYKLVTVRMHHNGVVLRELKKGKLIGSNMYRVKSGQFILSGIDARHGAFGVVPEELDDAVVTNDFWYFDVDEEVVSRDFFLWLTTTPLFLDACIKSSEGTTNRRRLQGDKFFNFSFYFPKIDEQKRLAEKFNAIDTTFAAMKDKFEQQSEYLKQLRQAVLQEAVEGKLTAEWRKQHPVVMGDPHYDAVALLAQIKAEKERLVTEGKIRKEKPQPLITDTDKPFDLPEGWVWCRLGEVVELITKGSSPSWQGVSYVEKNNGVLFITSKNVGSYSLDLTDTTYVELKFNDIEPKSILKAGDILTNIVGASIGRTAIYNLDEIANINQAVCLIRYSHDFMMKEYFLHWMNCDWIISKMHEDEFAPGRANLSMGNVAQFPIPLPPLAEQQAIVARVDSLMAVIDELEKQVAGRREQAQMLMQTVLREAFDSDSAAQ